MIITIIISAVWASLIMYLYKTGRYPLKRLHKILKNALTKPGEKEAILLIALFVIFLFLPLFWGLAIFLKTDANVVVVIFFLVWAYNWIKFILLTETE